MPLTLATIRTDVSSILRLDMNDADLKTLVDRAINDAIQDIHSRYDWYWTLDREVVQTVADKTAGTVAVNSGATAVTGTTTAFASADVGKFIQFSTSNNWYKITAAASATSLTLEANYVASSNLSGGTYTIRQFYYNVSASVDKILNVRQTIGPDALTPMTYRAFDIARPHPTSTGTPTVYFLYGVDSSNRLRFSVYPYPDSIMNLDIRYKGTATELSADGDAPAIPAKWRQVVIAGALYHRMRTVNPSESVLESIRIQKAAYEDGIAHMIADADPESSDYHPIIGSRERRNFLAQDTVRMPADYGQ